MRVGWVLLILMFARLALADGAAFSCVASGKYWQVVRASNHQRVGPTKYGLGSAEGCAQAVRDVGLHSICTWNGAGGYQPYSIETGKAIGKASFGYNNLDACTNATAKDFGGVVCNWNGGGYTPYFSGSGNAVGGAGNGFENVDNCLSLETTALHQVVCNWDAKNYNAYDKRSGRVVKTFKDFDACLQFAQTPSVQNPSAYQWLSDAGHISGCTFTDVSFGKSSSETFSASDCEKRLPMTFTISDDGATCTELTPEGQVFATPAMDVCIAHEKDAQTYSLKGASSCIYLLNGTRSVPVLDASVCAKAVDEYDPDTHAITLGGVAHWTGTRGDECAEFLPDPKSGELTYAHKVASSNCAQPSQTYYQWADATSKACVAYTACGVSVGSVDVKYCAGKVNRFAMKWPSKGYTWNACVNASDTGTTIPFDKKGNFLPQCAPDALYAWHAWDRISTAMSGHETSAALSFGSNRYFLWRTPVGSFGYGNALMRYKLRAGVKFVWVDFGNRECAKLEKSYDTKNTVFVDRNADTGNGNFSEYVLCSANPIESWSTDLPQNADEMEREYAWIKKATDVNFDSLSGTNLNNCYPWAIDQNWDSAFGHNNDWSETALQANIQHARKNTSAGQVFFDKNVVPSLWNHFSTAHAGYFNPYDATSANGALETWPERDAQACQPPKH